MGLLAKFAAFFTSSVFTNLINAVLGPVLSYMGKKQDDTLAGFQTATGADTVAYQAYLNYQVQITAAKAQANSWWGARLLYMIVGLAAVMHTTAIILDSTVRLGCGHYGCLGVPPLPGVYADFEHTVIYSLFVTMLAGGPVSAVSAWLHRK